jgi:hypothetical protein
VELVDGLAEIGILVDYAPTARHVAEVENVIRTLLEGSGVCCKLLECNSPTIHKLRVMSRSQQLIRLDSEQILSGHSDAFVGLFAEEIKDVHIIVISDYGKGTLDEKSIRRSVYFTVKRGQLIPMLQLFDWPDAMQGIGTRERSTVAPQALTLLNTEEVQDRSNEVALNLVGKTSIGVLGELLRRVDLVVGNDSGPIHIAAAVGTSGVVVSNHPVDGEPWVVCSPCRYRPWGVPSVVLQPPTGLESCGNWPTCVADDPHCILSVSDVEVVEAAMMLLAKDGLVTSGS